jgi:hypothetical protein
LTSSDDIGVGYTAQTAWGLPLGSWASLAASQALAPIDVLTTEGRSTYQSLTTAFDHKMSHGLSARAQWTLSHSIDNTAIYAQNPLDFRNEKAASDFDVRHRLSGSLTWGIPGHFSTTGSARKFLAGIFERWDLNAVATARSGLPVNVTLAIPDVPAGVAFQGFARPDNTGAPTTPTGDRRAMLDPSAFTAPAPGTYGNLGRNALRGPSLVSADASMARTWQMNERINLQFRGEIFNILNRANFANPPARLPLTGGTGVFGVANDLADNGLGASRQFRLNLTLRF